MMNTIKNFMDKQWTWGTYFKFCGFAAGLYCAIIAGVCAWEKWKEHQELKEMKKLNEAEYEI